MKVLEKEFEIVSSFEPAGDQPKAIREIVEGFSKYDRITLLGVTGSGKTFTMAHVIKELSLPTLVVSHNKTLAAQLYREFKQFFPYNAVEYFVSYYDYYQPEAYIPQTDTYIEKQATINDEIDRLRISATASLLSRKDVIVVASVSCIYGIGAPSEFVEFVLLIRVGDVISPRELSYKLAEMQYERSDYSFTRSTFRVMGDRVDVHPAYSRDYIRIEFFGDEVVSIKRYDSINNSFIENHEAIVIYPAKLFVSSRSTIEQTVEEVYKELEERVKELKSQGKDIEAKRLEMRTKYDMDLLLETGYCPGIENYSRYLSKRKPGERPYTLLDYFPKEFLTIIDESHVTVPQIRGMYNGDRSRKETLVEFGFRLPSALDNRPLRFEEFDSLLNKVLYVSATPDEYEISISGKVVEQIVRPTGLLDPIIYVRPTEGQVEDIIREVIENKRRGERTIITTLTKKMAEDLTKYLVERGVKAIYIHDEIEVIERVEILRDLRKGEYDCIVGINLLREGIDLPEVSLVCILDADKVGFLRSATSLIQIIGRSARHVNGRVIMYADKISDAMRQAIEETERRRKIQIEYNQQHNITPRSVKKEITDIIERKHERISGSSRKQKVSKIMEFEDVIQTIQEIKDKYKDNIGEMVRNLSVYMFELAERLEFEKASIVRDEIRKVEYSV
ncbi:MAG: excinuclease ABC subunit UvrB [Spirochaetia bacterium]|nr:excinuclease ABC subunit UvrB [Spirochaetota bacterium]MCX8096114.1 excinuclease ABC subunit UvrB [Spirochaetota bacterium]MDW8113070.1 excinuclease ABC subunit UvrB [Spirochaetia bacterium]